MININLVGHIGTLRLKSYLIWVPQRNLKSELNPLFFSELSNLLKFNTNRKCKPVYSSYPNAQAAVTPNTC